MTRAQQPKVAQNIIQVDSHVFQTFENVKSIKGDRIAIQDVELSEGSSDVMLRVSVAESSSKSSENKLLQTIFINFKSVDAAKIMKQILSQEEKSYVFVFDKFSNGVRKNIIRNSILEVDASAIFIWNEDQKNLIRLGDLIAPKRNFQNLSIQDKTLIRLGIRKLNDI